MLKSLKKRPLDYFKHNFYADTATFSGKPATSCGLEFYPTRQDRVRLRLPVRSGKGHDVHPRDAARSSTSIDMSKANAQGDRSRQSGADHRQDVREVIGRRPHSGARRRSATRQRDLDARTQAGRFCLWTARRRVKAPPPSASVPAMDAARTIRPSRRREAAAPSADGAPVAGDGAIHRDQGRQSGLPAVLPDGRFLRVVLRGRRDRVPRARHRADQARQASRPRHPDVRRAGASLRRISAQADRARPSRRGVRAARRPGRGAGSAAARASCGATSCGW